MIIDEYHLLYGLTLEYHGCEMVHMIIGQWNLVRHTFVKILDEPQHLGAAVFRLKPTVRMICDDICDILCYISMCE